MSDIIEAAARAMCEGRFGDKAWHFCGQGLGDGEREWYRNIARHVLAAVTPLIRAAALEEAALVAHDHGRYSEAYLDGDLPDDVVIHNRACWAIRDKQRALKEQP